MKKDNRKQFRFWLSNIDGENKEFFQWLKSQNNLSEKTLFALRFIKDNDINVNDLDSLTIQKMKTEIRYKNAKAEKEELLVEYERWKKQFRETFEIEPTEEAVKAMKKRKNNFEQTRQVAKKNIDDMVSLNWKKLLKELRFDKNNHCWRAGCTSCRKDIYLSFNRDESIDKFQEHIKQNHQEEILA